MDDSFTLIQEGTLLTKRQFSQQREQLRQDPNDLSIRLKLLGYLDRYQCVKGDNLGLLSEHLVWMVEHHSRHEGHEYVLIHGEGPEFRAVKRAWLKQVRLHPDDTSILHNAALCCRFSSGKHAERFWSKAHSLQPNNDEFPRRLAELYQHRGRLNNSKRQMRKAVDYAIIAVDTYQRWPTRSYFEVYLEMILSHLADDAFILNLPDLADELGQRMMNISEVKLSIQMDDGKERTVVSHRKAPHVGRSICGRAALARGDVAKAKSFLQMMTKAPKPKHPDVALARELMKKGEVETVKAYLQSCLDLFRQILEHLKVETQSFSTTGRVVFTPEQYFEVRSRPLNENIEQVTAWFAGLQTKRAPKFPNW